MDFIQTVTLIASLFLWKASHSQYLIHQAEYFSQHQQITNFLLNFYEASTETHRSENIKLKHLSILAPSFPTAFAQNITPQCIEDSKLYAESLYLNRSLWALQMQESSGHIPPGIFGSGNIHADGLFDECLSVQALNFTGKYCTIFFKLQTVEGYEISVSDDIRNDTTVDRSNMLSLIHLLALSSGTDRTEPVVSAADSSTSILPSLSFCLPSSCSAEDLGQSVAQQIGSYVILNNKSIVTVADEGYCFDSISVTSSRYDEIEITVIVIFSLLALFVLTATLHDAWRMYMGISFDKEKDSRVITIAHCFSAIENGRKILSMENLTSKDNLGCIHGIRFFSTCWVVLGHTWNFAAYKAMNPKAIKTDALSWSMQVIFNGTISVDTFLTISGLLVSYLLFRELDSKQGRANFGLFYLHRYLRLTPVYALVFSYTASLIVFSGIGPNWYSVISAANQCRIDWWKHFLYVNNLFPMQAQCMAHSWYLSVDMQLFIVSPLFIYPLWRWKKWGLVCLFLTLAACHASILMVYAIYDLMPTLIFTRLMDVSSSSLDYYQHYYMKPWTRAPPYLIGIFTGWYLNGIKRRTDFYLSKGFVAFGWTASILVGLAVLFGMSPYLDPSTTQTIPPVVAYTYGTFHRTAWAAVFSWVVLACSCGYGGFVNTVLSWKGFLPLGRLTYCVYLIHYDFLNAFYSANRKQFYYTMTVSSTLEASFLNLEKLLLSSKRKSK